MRDDSSESCIQMNTILPHLIVTHISRGEEGGGAGKEGEVRVTSRTVPA